MSKLMTNKAAIPGGDSIGERGTSIPRGLDSDAIVKECRKHLGSRAITVEVDSAAWLSGRLRHPFFTFRLLPRHDSE